MVLLFDICTCNSLIFSREFTLSLPLRLEFSFPRLNFLFGQWVFIGSIFCSCAQTIRSESLERECKHQYFQTQELLWLLSFLTTLLLFKQTPKKVCWGEFSSQSCFSFLSILKPEEAIMVRKGGEQDAKSLESCSTFCSTFSTHIL